MRPTALGKIAAVLALVAALAIGVTTLSAGRAEAAKPVPTFTASATATGSSGSCTYSYSFVSNDAHGTGIVEVLSGSGAGVVGVAQIPLRVDLTSPITGSVANSSYSSMWFELVLMDMQGNTITTSTTPTVSCP